MSVLGTMMLRAGLLSESQVDAANEHAAMQGSSHVDAILELGLADEDTLVAFLASKLMIPRVRSAVLERVGHNTTSRLSPLLAWDHVALPVSYDDLGNLTVAMADPTDERAIRAIAAQTRTYLVRAVASASELRRAIERIYGPERQVREQAAAQQTREADRPTDLGMQPVTHTQAPPGVQNPAPPASVPPVAAPPVAAPPVAPPAVSPPVAPSPPTAAPQVPQAAPAPAVPAPTPEPPAAAPYMSAGAVPLDDDRDDVPIRASHGAAQEVSSGPSPAAQASDPAPSSQPGAPSSDPAAASEPAVTRGPRRGRAQSSWNPPLAGVASEPVPLSPEAFAQVLPLIEETTDRDQITTLLLDFLGAGFNRVILFLHSHNELRGLDARGKDLLVEAVRQVRIPTTGKSMFSDVIERCAPYFGPMRNSTKIDEAFSAALGGVKGNLLLLPIALGNKVPLLLWAHGTSHPVDPRSITELATAVSAAIHRIIAAAKRR